MAGGTWTAQNKVRPGIYINIQSRGTPLVTAGTRGTVAIAKALSWGPVGVVTALSAGDDLRLFTGYAATEEPAMFLRELFKGTNVTSGPSRVLLYRLPAQGATAASATIGEENGITVTARHPGVRGNDISVTVSASVDEPDRFTVTTLVDGQRADVQTVKSPAELTPNGWVLFSGSGPLTATAGVTLTGGADGSVQPSAYADALAALEPWTFDVLAYDGTEATVREAMAAFVRRLAEQEGKYTQLVSSGAQGTDSAYVINTNTSVILSDGTRLAPNEVVWWLAGAEAGAQYYQSLSCAAYPGAADVAVKRSSSEIDGAILAGDIVLTQEFGQVRIETDINTLTTFTPDQGEVFRKNTAMRVCSSLANDVYREFSLHYRGKVKNNAAGRGLLKAAILDLLLDMYSKEALRERPTGDDVTVEQGDGADSVVITAAIAIGDMVEKVYLTVTVS